MAQRSSSAAEYTPDMRRNSAGTHLTIDGYVRDPDLLDEGPLARMIIDLVDLLGMTILHGPTFVEVALDPAKLARAQETGVFEDEGGVTAFAVISTSHISIHCWPLQNFFSMDVFSCKDFDARTANEFVRDRLGVTACNDRAHYREKPAIAPLVNSLDKYAEAR